MIKTIGLNLLGRRIEIAAKRHNLCTMSLLEIAYTDRHGVFTTQIVRPLELEQITMQQCRLKTYCFLRNAEQTFVLGRINTVKILASCPAVVIPPNPLADDPSRLVSAVPLLRDDSQHPRQGINRTTMFFKLS